MSHKIFIFPLILLTAVLISQPASAKKLQEKLRETAAVSFDRTPLGRAVETLGNAHDAVIFLDVPALEEEGLDADEPITLKTGGISLAGVLHLMLEPLNLVFYEDGEKITITSKERQDETLREKIYPVLWDDPDALITVFTTIVAKDSWDAVGGNGTIELVPGGVGKDVIRVRQSPQVLDELDTLYERFLGKEEVIPESVKRLTEALESRVQLNCREMPMDDFFACIEKALHIPVVLDVSGLEGEGFSPDEPCTIEVQNTRLQDALEIMLGPKNLAAIIHHEVLWITCKERANDRMEVRLYPGKFGYWGEDAEDVDSIITAVTIHCAKDMWDAVGGLGTICWVPDRYVICQTRKVHEEVSRFFDVLRNPPKRMPEPETEQEKRLAEILATRVSLEYKEKPLGEIAADLREKYDLPVKLDARRLEEEGLDEKEPILFSVQGISLENALRGMLLEKNLTILADREILWITSREHANETQVTRFYPWDFKIEKRKRVYRGGGMMSGDYSGGMGGFGFNLKDDLPEGAFYQMRIDFIPPGEDYDVEYPVVEETVLVGADEIIMVITTIIAKDSWDYVGGPGVISCLPGMIIITQTPAIHREVEKLLKALKGEPEPPTEAETRMEEILARRVSLEYDQKTLGEIVTDLRKRFGLPACLDRVGLESEGMSEDDRFSVSVRDISLENALRAMFFRSHGACLTILPHGEILWITSREHANETLETKVIPWKFDTGKYRRSEQNRALFGSNGQLGHGCGCMIGAPGRCLHEPEQENSDEPADTILYQYGISVPPEKEGDEAEDEWVEYLDADSIITTIVTTVAKDSWDAVGGPGTICPWVEEPSALIISQTREAHQEIEKLLKSLKGEAEPTEMETRIGKMLPDHVSLDVRQRPWMEIVADFSKKYSVNFIDQRYFLAEADILGEKVTLRAEEMPVWMVLEMILKPLELDYSVRYDSVVVTTSGKIGDYYQARVYDVADALARYDDDLDYDSLITYLEENVAPDSWDAAGGAGIMAAFPQTFKLVVVQTPAVHGKIEKAIQKYRAEEKHRVEKERVFSTSSAEHEFYLQRNEK